MERLQVPKKYELALLLDIVLEASKWRVSEGDERDPLRMEVEDRLSRLMPDDGYDGVEVNGVAEITPEIDSQRRYAETHVRVMDPTTRKKKWYLRELCEKVPIGNGNPGFKWVLKKEAQNV